MFLLLAIGIVFLCLAFVAGAISRLFRPQAPEVRPEQMLSQPTSSETMVNDPWYLARHGPQVWEQNLVGIDAKPTQKPSMGNWD